jgi:L-glutamine:2-deoxy-scyllo-inosose/3-amino-2,3-dideoxy-scyllo-inosose aminotransferase
MKTTLLAQQSQLAVLGGNPIFKEPLSYVWPPIDTATEELLVKTYRSRVWSFNGPLEQQLCKEFAELHTAKHAIFMANGTVTLEAALHVLGIGKGDEVIVPALTWVASAMAVLYVGATPVFVDIDQDTLCLDLEKAAKAITPKTKAIMPVHIYGSMVDMDKLLSLAKKHGLKIIEDCAHAQGGIWNGKGIGSLGDMGSFSFQQSKSLSSGEGGMVITNDDQLAERLYRFKHIGYYPATAQGKASTPPQEGLTCHNYRGTDFQAALLLGQVRALKDLTKNRNTAAKYLTENLEKLPGIKVQTPGAQADLQSYYGFMLTFDPAHWGNANRSQIMLALQKEGLVLMPTYGSVYRHILWNISKDKYRIHDNYTDEKGPGCQVSEEIAMQRTFGFLHPMLDFPRSEHQKIINAFIKVQENAEHLSALKPA